MGPRTLYLSMDLAIPVVERLTEAQEKLTRRLGEQGVRWVPPEQIHLTLRTLGDMDESLLELLEPQLRRFVEPLFPFQVSCRGVGAWPSEEAPRHIWTRLDEQGAEVVGLLRRALDRELDQLGIAPDPRTYRPLIALGRARELPRQPDRWLGELREEVFGTSVIKDLILFEATLRPDGPHHRVINRFSLGAP